jgi:RNA polymerase sigma-70 factor (sigma-E family)
MRATSVTIVDPDPPGNSAPTRFGSTADAAVGELYAAHWRRLVRLSVLLVHDQGLAEEIVQDAFVAMHGRWSRLRDPSSAAAYLRQAVVNRSRSALRHRKVVDRYVATQRYVEAGPDASGPVEAAARRDAVLTAMRALPRRQREVIALRYYLDLSEADIAETLGISTGAVKSHASRGAAALRESLAEHLEDLR